jgi:hypothetical protein
LPTTLTGVGLDLALESRQPHDRLEDEESAANGCQTDIGSIQISAQVCHHLGGDLAQLVVAEVWQHVKVPDVRVALERRRREVWLRVKSPPLLGKVS